MVATSQYTLTQSRILYYLEKLNEQPRFRSADLWSISFDLDIGIAEAKTALEGLVNAEEVHHMKLGPGYYRIRYPMDSRHTW